MTRCDGDHDNMRIRHGDGEFMILGIIYYTTSFCSSCFTSMIPYIEKQLSERRGGLFDREGDEEPLVMRNIGSCK